VTLTPGTYCTDAALTATGVTLTLDAQNNPDAVWIFQIGAALTGTNFSVVMAGGGKACNVFWVPSAAATMTTSTLKGNILAGGATGSITLTGGTLDGRALAKVAVTMTDSVVGCGGLAAALDALSCAPNERLVCIPKHRKPKEKCNQGVGNRGEDCDPGHSNRHHPTNDEDPDDKPGHPGRQGGGR
jgi:hypothetical protein